MYNVYENEISKKGNEIGGWKRKGEKEKRERKEKR